MASMEDNDDPAFPPGPLRVSTHEAAMLSKSRYLAGLQCPKRLWLLRAALASGRLLLLIAHAPDNRCPRTFAQSPREIWTIRSSGGAPSRGTEADVSRRSPLRAHDARAAPAAGRGELPRAGRRPGPRLSPDGPPLRRLLPGGAARPPGTPAARDGRVRRPALPAPRLLRPGARGRQVRHPRALLRADAGARPRGHGVPGERRAPLAAAPQGAAAGPAGPAGGPRPEVLLDPVRGEGLPPARRAPRRRRAMRLRAAPHADRVRRPAAAARGRAVHPGRVPRRPLSSRPQQPAA